MQRDNVITFCSIFLQASTIYCKITKIYTNSPKILSFLFFHRTQWEINPKMNKKDQYTQIGPVVIHNNSQ